MRLNVIEPYQTYAMKLNIPRSICNHAYSVGSMRFDIVDEV